MPQAAATWFGGDDDPEDNGQTASGVPTKGNPTLLGCALPLNGNRYFSRSQSAMNN